MGVYGHRLYLIVYLPTELYSPVILLSLCVQYIINYNLHAKMTSYLSHIIFDGPSSNRVVEPGHLAIIMFLEYNQL